MIRTLLMCSLYIALFSGTAWGNPTKPATSPPEGMALIPAGEFRMGSPQAIGEDDEHPQHSVYLKSFFMDVTEVTQEDYEKVMGKNPSHFKGKNLPVEKVTWSEARAHCQTLGKRLPTEAEWEKAARGSRNLDFSWGSEVKSKAGNFCDNQCDKKWKSIQFEDGYKNTSPVKSYSPNDYGLFDMSGNVYEWVKDWYHKDTYKESPYENPKGPETGTFRVIRGGAWDISPVALRNAYRFGLAPDSRSYSVGFRCAQSTQ